MNDTDHTNDADRNDTTDETRPEAVRRTTNEQDGEAFAESVGRTLQRRSVLKVASVFPFVLPFGTRPMPPGRSETSGPTDDLEEGDKIAVSRIIRFPDRYEFEVATREGGEADPTVSGRVDGADQYIRTEHRGGTTESYLVEGTIYVVANDRCIEYPAVTADSRRGDGKSSSPPGGRPDPLAEVTDVTTIDGRETLVLELLLRPHDLPTPAREAREDHAKGLGVRRQLSQPDVTYYVDVEAGFLRRLETESITIIYHSWGEVAPVSAPDLDCSEPEIPSS